MVGDHRLADSRAHLVHVVDLALTVIDRVFAFFASLGLIALMVIGGLEVVGRTTGWRLFRGQVEWSEVVLVTIVFLAFAHAQRTRQHVAVDLVTRQLPARPRRWVQTAGDTLGAIFLFAMSWMAFPIALDSMAEREARYGATGAPIWPARMILAIALLLTAMRLLLQALGTDQDETLRQEGRDAM